jgi:hypothetical protein
MSQQSSMETMSPTPASYSARIMYPAKALSRSLAMTLGYDHPAPEHLRSAVARLDTPLAASDFSAGDPSRGGTALE